MLLEVYPYHALGSIGSFVISPYLLLIARLLYDARAPWTYLTQNR
jgi:hypothetical protein